MDITDRGNFINHGRFCLQGYTTYKATLWSFPLVGLPYGLILAAVVCPSSLVYHFKSFITSWLATLSYSIYLSHKIVIHVTQNLFRSVGMDKNSNLMMLISMVAVVAAALIMRYAIEKPALALRNKILTSDFRPHLILLLFHNHKNILIIFFHEVLFAGEFFELLFVGG